MDAVCYGCGRSGDPALDIREVIIFKKIKDPGLYKPIIQGEKVDLCYYCRKSSPLQGAWKYEHGTNYKADRKMAVCTLWHTNTGHWVATGRTVQTFFPITEVSSKDPNAAILALTTALEYLKIKYRWSDPDMYRKVEAVRNGSL